MRDFSVAPPVWNNPNYGTGAAGQGTWYAACDGAAGVQAFGMAQNGVQYTMWTGLIPLPKIYDEANGFDYQSYTHITLRMKADKEKLTGVFIGTDNVTRGKNLLDEIAVSNEWTTVTLNIVPEMGTYYLMIDSKADATACESVWIDQVWVTYVEPPVEELPIPEGSALVKDFSTESAPWNIPNWGLGAGGATHWEAEHDGVAGVQAFGIATPGAQLTMWTAVLPLPTTADPNGFNYYDYTTITLRMKVNKEALNGIYIGDTAGTYPFLDQIPVSNEWTTVTLNIDASMGVFYFAIYTKDGTEATDLVWFDQVWVTKVEEPVVEQAIPEGSVLVSDFSTAGAPWNNPGWGTGAVGQSTWYAEYDGVAGVQAFGAAQGGAQYTQWASVIPLPKIYDDANGFNYHGYTTITLRLKVNKDAIRALYIGDTAVSYEFLGQVPVSNEWTTVTLPINDSMGAYYLMIGTSDGAAAGESVWIDQVYVQ